jgi:hypothetical protein
VLKMESESCTAPHNEVVAALIEMVGVAPGNPPIAMGEVPMREDIAVPSAAATI